MHLSSTATRERWLGAGGALADEDELFSAGRVDVGQLLR